MDYAPGTQNAALHNTLGGVGVGSGISGCSSELQALIKQYLATGFDQNRLLNASRKTIVLVSKFQANSLQQPILNGQIAYEA